MNQSARGGEEDEGRSESKGKELPRRSPSNARVAVANTTKSQSTPNTPVSSGRRRLCSKASGKIGGAAADLAPAVRRLTFLLTFPHDDTRSPPPPPPLPFALRSGTTTGTASPCANGAPASNPPKTTEGSSSPALWPLDLCSNTWV
jgi:hypothetical protein